MVVAQLWITWLWFQVRSNILSAFVNLLATLRAEYSFDDQTIIGCPTQEQLAALLASVMVVHVSNRSRAINSSSREVSENPELVFRKMLTKSVKFQESTEETESNSDTIEAGSVFSDATSNGDVKESEDVSLSNGNSIAGSESNGNQDIDIV